MEYRKITGIDSSLSVICLGTWAFGGDNWWGKQEDRDSTAVLAAAIERGVNFIDTAPIYGKGRSERVIGGFINKRQLREKLVLATKVGLAWDGPTILHNLKRKRMLEEVDQSRQRLKTDYFDLYQVHWPDPDTPIGETAETMYGLYQQGIIKSIGVSNYSVEKMREFMRYCPLHSLQPPYSMFNRKIEEAIVPFCGENKIAIITYAPLYSGLLTGKFFFGQVPVPDDTNRKMKRADLEEPRFTINKMTLENLNSIAAGYKKTLAELVINWNFSQRGITAAIVGMRNLSQVEDNLGSVGWKISDTDMQAIDRILQERENKIKNL